VILKESDARSKLCGVFGSFGWSGEAVDEMEQLLKDGGFSFAFPTVRCKFKVSGQVVRALFYRECNGLSFKNSFWIK
jgi:flavorubredoxin